MPFFIFKIMSDLEVLNHQAPFTTNGNTDAKVILQYFLRLFPPQLPFFPRVIHQVHVSKICELALKRFDIPKRKIKNNNTIYVFFF